MADPKTHVFRGYAGSPQLLRARIVKPDGVALLQADSATFDLRVFDVSQPDGYVLLEELLAKVTSPADANDGYLYDTLQTSMLLPDGLGFNFNYVVRPTLFVAEGERRYRLEFKFNTNDTATGPLYAVWEWLTAAVLGDSV